MTDVVLTGGKRLQRAIDHLTDEVERRVLDESVVDAGRTISKEAKIMAPVRTRQLRDSIKYLVVKRNPGEIEVDVGPDATRGWYGVFAEFGTKYMTAKPFMRPAFDNSLNDVKRNFRRKLIRAIRDASRG